MKQLFYILVLKIDRIKSFLQKWIYIGYIVYAMFLTICIIFNVLNSNSLIVYPVLHLFNIEYFYDNDFSILNNKYSHTKNNTYLNISNNTYNNNYIYSDTNNNNQNIEKATEFISELKGENEFFQKKIELKRYWRVTDVCYK